MATTSSFAIGAIFTAAPAAIATGLVLFSFYGSVHVENVPVVTSLPITVWINGIQVAQATTFVFNDYSAYRINCGFEKNHEDVFAQILAQDTLGIAVNKAIDHQFQAQELS